MKIDEILDEIEEIQQYIDDDDCTDYIMIPKDIYFKLIKMIRD